MDTFAFHFTMFAVDAIVLTILLVWPLHKSALWGLFGWALTCFVGLCGIVVAAKIYSDNFGQCAVEGLTYHGTGYLFIAAGILVWKRRWGIGLVSALVGVPIFCIGFNMLVWEPYSLVVEHYEIETPKLTKRVRIVFVADIQTDQIRAHERRTLELIQEQNADLIILGGDYLQTYKDTPRDRDLPEQFRQLFLDVPLSAPLGVFTVAGNIDGNNPEHFKKLFDGTTVEPILSSEIFENLGIDKDKGPIDLVLLGLGNSTGYYPVGQWETETGNFMVMAGHYPVYAIKEFQDSKEAPDLMLAGHTHGGQLALPFYGPLKLVKADKKGYITRDFLRGMKTFSNGGKLIISRGSGMERGWAPRVRLLCPPEISVIDIIPKDAPEKK